MSVALLFKITFPTAIKCTPTLFDKSRHLRSETAPAGDRSPDSRETPTPAVSPSRRERRYSSPVELFECLSVLDDHTEDLDPSWVGPRILSPEFVSNRLPCSGHVTTPSSTFISP